MKHTIEENTLDKELPHVSRASRYLGNEINAVRKNPGECDITFAFAFPDTYEVGMSHAGLQILYERLNSFAWIACERVFAPWVDMMQRMQDSGMALHTLENRRTLTSCDIVGFSIEYELACPTVLRMLELAGIPLLAAERGSSWPLVIAGGPCTYNPEPIADFFDACIIGEAEDAVIELCDAVRTWKNRPGARDKSALLAALGDIEGVYVPSLFTQSPGGGVIPRAGTPAQVTKRIMHDFSRAPACTRPVVPYMQIIHDRAAVEIARGCTRGCRFCMAGIVYRPLREKDAGTIFSLARGCLAASGYEELGLLSLSSSDHSAIHAILPGLMQDARRDMTALSLPSLRADSLSPAIMEEIKKVRKTGFTIAPEAGTQRLRDVINKGITRRDIIETAAGIFDAGWNLIKLYFMIGLPTETDEDLDGIIDIARALAAINRRKQVTVSISTFVPKPHTPFQWEAQDSADDILRKQRYLQERLRVKNIQCKFHNHHLSLLEGVFARGDRRLGRVLVEAHRLGAGFEAWSEHFKPELWEQAFKNAGMRPADYLRQRPLDAPLPWDHISCGVSRAFLERERRRAYTARITPDCRGGECQGCGVCEALGACVELAPACPGPDGVSAQAGEAEVYAAAGPHRYRISYAKTGPARFLSHLELTRVFARALRRARLPLKYSEGFHPMPRITFHAALPVGMESEEEFCDILLLQDLDAASVFECCAALFPEGLDIREVQRVALQDRQASPSHRAYRIGLAGGNGSLPDLRRIRDLIGRFDDQPSREFCLQRKKGAVIIDLKQVVREISLCDDGHLMLRLNPEAGALPRIGDIAGEILELPAQARVALAIRKLRA